MVLHLLYESFVKAEAVSVVLGDERLQNEPEALPDLRELHDVGDVCERHVVS